MTKKTVSNIPASIRQRLLNLSHERKDDFGLILTQFAIERLLFRLSMSTYADQFVLKGAQLFLIWMEMPHRPTRDLDLLHQGDSGIQQLEAIFSEVSTIITEPPDGIIFYPDSVKGIVIREDAVYEGVRINIQFSLNNAKDVLQIDIGTGDIVVPAPDMVKIISLLDFPPVNLRAYPKETVIAEKLEAMISLGISNSRMKDFYDLWILSKSFQFDGKLLSHAIAATFQRRQTKIPALPPLALTPEFWQESAKQTQWRAFIRRLKIDETSHELKLIIADLSVFILPLLTAISTKQNFSKVWDAVNKWHIIQNHIEENHEND